MKQLFTALRHMVSIMAVFIFLCGVVLAVIGAFDFIKVFNHIGSGAPNIRGLMAVGLLHAVDAFLVATVFFVLSLGLLILFNNTEGKFQVNLPEWLRLKNFMELKAILWEAILTTLVVAYLARMAERAIVREEFKVETLVIPGGIFLIALSLYFLKKGEH